MRQASLDRQYQLRKAQKKNVYLSTRDLHSLQTKARSRCQRVTACFTSVEVPT